MSKVVYYLSDWDCIYGEEDKVYTDYERAMEEAINICESVGDTEEYYQDYLDELDEGERALTYREWLRQEIENNNDCVLHIKEFEVIE